MGKLVCDIAHKQDLLWARWVHSIHIKDQRWWDYQQMKQDSSICKTKDYLKDKCNIHTWPNSQRYYISRVYKACRHCNHKIDWTYSIWSRYAMPKHKFITWLAMHERLQTKEKLKKIGVCDDDCCLLCGIHT